MHALSLSEFWKDLRSAVSRTYSGELGQPSSGRSEDPRAVQEIKCQLVIEVVHGREDQRWDWPSKVRFCMQTRFLETYLVDLHALRGATLSIRNSATQSSTRCSAIASPSRQSPPSYHTILGALINALISIKLEMVSTSSCTWRTNVKNRVASVPDSLASPNFSSEPESAKPTYKL